MTFRELLAHEFAPYGPLREEQLDRLEAHYRLLKRWNRRLNLTRIESDTELSPEAKAQVLAQLRAKIAELRAR